MRKRLAPIFILLLSSGVVLAAACSGSIVRDHSDRPSTLGSSPSAIAGHSSKASSPLHPHQNQATSMAESKKQRGGVVDLNGAQAYYDTMGVGHPLVLVHAGIADSRMWDHQVGSFARHFHVVTYDMRGFGRTIMPAGPFAHDQDLDALTRSLGLDITYLLGCSLGGSVAIDYVLTHPGAVDGLVLVGSALDGFKFSDAATKDCWAQTEQALNDHDYEKAAQLEMKNWLAGSSRSLKQVDSSVRQLVREMLLAGYKATSDQGREMSPDVPSIKKLTQIRVPTLIIVGSLDTPDIRKIADTLASSIPGARQVVMQGVAHLPNLERPLEFNRIVLTFLMGLEKKRDVECQASVPPRLKGAMRVQVPDAIPRYCLSVV